MFRTLFYRLPVKWRYTVRRTVFYPIDLIESLTGKRPPMVPPKGMIFTGSGNFLEQGNTFLEYFTKYGQLEPNHRVLDIGSGIGRMAIPLTSYLKNGSYEGFDVVERGVKWCKQQISTRYSNFNFTYYPLHNDLYTESGESALQFKFPYADNEFDFVFLTSVFTHMLPEEVEHYMHEINRVLKPGGRVLATFFLLTEKSVESMANSEFNFSHNKGHYSLMDEKVKAANVAFSEQFFQKNLIDQANFRVIHLLPGTWSNRPDGHDFQDIVVAEKIK